MHGSISNLSRMHRANASTSRLLSILGVALCLALVPARLAPAADGLEGWRGRGPNADELGLGDAAGHDFVKRVSKLVGYNPFVIRTLSGDVHVPRGVDADLAALMAAPPLAGAPERHLCLLIPAVPAQKTIKEALEARQVKVVKRLRPNLYVVRATLDALRPLAGDPRFYWMGRLSWNRKIDPLLVKHLEIPQIQLADDSLDRAARIKPGKAKIVLYDLENKTPIGQAIKALGVKIERFDRQPGAFLCAGIDAESAARIARMPEIMFIRARRITSSAASDGKPAEWSSGFGVHTPGNRVATPGTKTIRIKGWQAKKSTSARSLAAGRGKTTEMQGRSSWAWPDSC